MSTAGFVQFIVKGIFGCVAAVACGLLYGIYLSTYHDRKFWFSTRQVGAGVFSSLLLMCFQYEFFTFFLSLKELERELTFQEGSGLYYYYYKHMLTAPSFERGRSPQFALKFCKTVALISVIFFQVYSIWSSITRRYRVRPSTLCSVCPSTPSSLPASYTESQTARWDFGFRLRSL